MGLDAQVHCNCFEKGLLRSEPDKEWEVSIADDGSRITGSDSLEAQIAFDRWNESACDHEDGIAIHERIGNIALVATLRAILEAEAHQLPILLEHVLYSGSHCGDWLTISQVRELEQELKVASSIHGSDQVQEEYLQNFIKTMHRLLAYSLLLEKPIVF